MATRRRGRALIFVAVILILVLVVVFAGWQLFLQPMLNPATPEALEPVNTPTPVEASIDVVMTTQKIARGSYLSQDSLMLVSMPKKDYVEGTFITQSEDPEAIPVIEDLVLNKRMRAAVDLKEKTPLTMEMLATGDSSTPSFQIPRGMVAISIPISKLSSVSYGLQAGDHVNVLASLLLIDIDPSFQSRLPNLTSGVTLPGRLADQFTGVAMIDGGVAGRGEYDATLGTPIYVIPSEGQRPRLVSQTLLQDIIILQMGIFAQGTAVIQPTAAPADPNAAPAEQPAQAAPAAIPVPDVVTLIVSPQDAISLNYLMLAGARLNLVMRSAGDSDLQQTEAVTLQFILDQYAIPNPAKLPYGIEPRTDNFMTNNNLILPYPDAGQPVLSLPSATPAP